MTRFKYLENIIDTPICSVCVANFNGREFIDDCLKSILSQEFHLPIEIILHDDASTDESVDFIKKNYPQVKLIISCKNVGYCVSNNRMVSQARGKYILLLNNDAILHKNAIKTFHNYAMMQCLPSILGLPQYDAESGELVDIGSMLDLFLNPIPNLISKQMSVAMVTGACFWLPRSLWDELGGFPEWFGSLSEDLYLCCLARIKGYPVVVLPGSGFDHWIGKNFGGGKLVNGSMRTSLRRRAMSERNKTFVMFLCYPAPYAYFLIPFHLIILIIEGIFISVMKRNISYWKFIYFNCIKECWARRKKLLSIRARIKWAVTSHDFFKFTRLLPYKLYMAIKHGIPHIEK